MCFTFRADKQAVIDTHLAHFVQKH